MKTTSKILLITAGVVLIAGIVTRVIWGMNKNDVQPWCPSNAQLPLKKAVPSFTSIYFEGDSTIRRNFRGQIIIKQGKRPQVNFETNAFGVGTNKRYGRTTLIINMDKAVVQKQKYNLYALTITTDRPLRSIENELENFNIEVRDLQGDDLNIIDNVSDGSHVNLLHCTFRNVNLQFSRNNYFCSDYGSSIDNVLIQGGAEPRKLFSTKNYSYFITALDREGKAGIYLGNGFNRLKNQMAEDDFRKEQGEYE
jgi:hypothetical protein